jgi:hypothetical protein
MNEFDNGRRATTEGYDRFSNTIVPLLVESTVSMIASGWHVDLYFSIWDDATPFGYDPDQSDAQFLVPVTRGLARQHRYVIKDLILQYDIFVNFEDDMLIKGTHVDHFVNVTLELYRLRHDAPHHFEPPVSVNQSLFVFHGEMTKTQLQRSMPGFIRVEATTAASRTALFPSDMERRIAKNSYFEQIPVNYDWDANRTDVHLDPSICCHISKTFSNEIRPMAPTKDDLVFWETSLDALGVRKLPDRAAWDWVLLQAGNVDDFYESAYYVIGDYWSGRDHGYFGKKPRPNRSLGRYCNNQGGWMGTRRQILEMHADRCHGGFLPPYNIFPSDGLDRQTVEFWSGGIQIAGPLACNTQRIIAMDPSGFSKHLLYHTSNNKQRAVNIRYRFPSRTIDEFWGQLNTVRKNADARMRLEEGR